MKLKNNFHMIQLKKVAILCLMIAVFVLNASGQRSQKDTTNANKPSQTSQELTAYFNQHTQVDSIDLDISLDLASQLQPLDSILAVAIRNSPSLHFEDGSVIRSIANMRATRYTFLNGISGFYNYTFGNQTNLNSINADGSVLNNSLGVGYRVGLNVTLPLTEIVTRPFKVKSAKADIMMAKEKRKDVELNVRRLVIQDYFNLLASQHNLWVRIQDLESARLTAEIATIEMKRGKITPSDLSRLKNVQAIAESNLETSKKEFMTYYYYLENWLGVKLYKLKRQQPIKK